MATEHPHYDPHPHPRPHRLPPVADRRAPERRSYAGRAAPPIDDRGDLARAAAAAAMAFCGGMAILFVFFWALGAIDVTDAVAATIVAVVLALVWVGGFLYRRRQEDAQEVIRHDRERRGF